MKTIFHYLIVLGLLIAAIGSYSYGNTTGMFIFVLLGFALEVVFWFRLFPSKK